MYSSAAEDHVMEGLHGLLNKDIQLQSLVERIGSGPPFSPPSN